jgi:fucose permease
MTTTEQTDAKTETSPSRTSLRWIRIIPVALTMYMTAFIDRTNRSLALPHISRDLHLDSQQAGTVAGIFFWGYLALPIPGGQLAKHWRRVDAA